MPRASADSLPNDVQIVLELEPFELGLAVLPMIRNLEESGHQPRTTDIPDQVARRYPPEHRAQVVEAVREAVGWLEGQALLLPDSRFREPHAIRRLSRSAIRLLANGNPHRDYTARRLNKEALHKNIRDPVWSLFVRGDYELAIVAAMRAVEVAVREAANYEAADHGKPMLGRAFHDQTGPLRDQAAPAAERQALLSLVLGAYGLFRNPAAHRAMSLDDPDEAAEIIMLANHLLRQVDAAAKRLAASQERSE